LHFKHRRKTIEGLRPLRRRVAAIDVQRMLQVVADLVRDGKLKIFYARQDVATGKLAWQLERKLTVRLRDPGLPAISNLEIVLRRTIEFHSVSSGPYRSRLVPRRARRGCSIMTGACP